jgi:hypothetical protein
MDKIIIDSLKAALKAIKAQQERENKRMADPSWKLEIGHKNT